MLQWRTAELLDKDRRLLAQAFIAYIRRGIRDPYVRGPLVAQDMRSYLGSSQLGVVEVK